MLLPSILLSVLYLVYHVPLALAVFADEAYRIDYQHALLGVPQKDTTFFHQPSATSKASLLYTLSDKLVLGAVNPKDGAIVWRQWLKESKTEENDTGYLKAVDGEDVVVSAVGHNVNAWDAADGRLVWQWVGRGPVRDLEVLGIEGVKGDVLVATEEEGKGVVTRLSGSSGEVVWEYSDESPDKPIAISASPTHIYYISLRSTSMLGINPRYTILDIVTGKQSAQATLAAEGATSSKESLLFMGANSAAPILVWADRSKKNLHINLLGGKYINNVKFENKEKEDIESITVHAPRATNAQPHFLVHYQTSKSHWAEVYHIDISSGVTSKKYELPKLGGLGAFSASTIDANVYFTRNTDFEVSLTSSASHGILARWPIRPKSHGGLADPEGISHAVSEVVSKAGSSFSIRSALTLSTGDWELVRNSDPVWIRPEGLTGIVAAAWAEIPAEEDLAKVLAVESHSNVLSVYIHRVKRHISDLEHFPAWLQKIPRRVIASFVGEKSGSLDQTLKPDSFGFRKIVIVATEKGRVAAIDAGMQGMIFWGIQAATIPEDDNWNVTSIEVQNDRIVVLVTGAEPTIIETMTGKILPSDGNLKVKATESVFSIPSTTSGQQLFLPVQPDGTPSSLPPGALSESTTLVTRRSSNTIAGWTVNRDGKTSLAWAFSPPAGESILALTTRPAHDPVASIGRVLGDRNVLYKYLSLNLLLVTAISAAASTLSIYLLDTITGQPLYTTTHTGVDTRAPMPATFAENWFAYSLFSDPAPSPNTSSPLPPKAHQLILTELYESPLPNDRGPLGSSPKASSLTALPLPHALSAAYVIPAPLTHLASTSTLQGITPRALLATAHSLSALLAIPLPLLSPRRPVGRAPTPVEAEEGLVPYAPALDFSPHWLLTHAREVRGLRGVSACPTRMESTSAVVAWGELDLFGTRVSPIGAFDTLGGGFGRLQLLGTVLALGVGTGVLGPMVRRRQVDGLWRA
ncbi:hypothetical protein MMC13_002545 [Lambiella insularis]|nr:hypothetical protein [Lambiella insularis]